MQSSSTWNPLNCSLLSHTPKYGIDSPWEEHIPAAMLLVDLLKPRLFVELGTYAGISYRSVCDAVTCLGLSTECLALGKWGKMAEGDPWGAESLADFRLRHDPLYGHFSRILSLRSLEEAAAAVEKGSVDLLHFAHRATSDPGASFFETWLPKMSPRGVMLFSNTCGDASAPLLRRWNHAKEHYLSFEFTHAHGLGILAVGNEYPGSFMGFLAAANAEAERYRNFFRAQGQRVRESAKQRIRTDSSNLVVQKAQTKLKEVEEALCRSYGEREQMRARLQEAQQRQNDDEKRLLKAVETERDLVRREWENELLQKRLTHVFASRSWKLGRVIVRPAAWLLKPVLRLLFYPLRVVLGKPEQSHV